MYSEQAHAEGATLVQRLLAGLVAAVCRRPVLVLAAALVAGALSLWAFCTRLEYRTQRSDLVSPAKDYQRRWRRYLAEFGSDDDMVVVVEGRDRPRMKAALDALGERARRQPQHFDRLFYKVDLAHLRNRALLFLPTEQIAQIQDNLKSMDRLLKMGPIGWQLFTFERLLGEAGERARRARPGEPLSPADAQFFTQFCAISRSATDTLQDPAVYNNPWRSLVSVPAGQPDLLAEPQYFFSDDPAHPGTSGDTLAFLLVRPVKQEGSFTAGRESVEALRAIVANVRGQYPDLQMGVTGLPVLDNDEMVAAEHDTRLASWLAIAGITMLFVVVYRGIAYPLLTVGTLLVGTAWAMGWMTLTVGHLNILSATFAVMLIGMGDYGVLWVMRYEQARRRGATVPEALRHTAVHVAVGNLTAATTLALAFYAAMFADFQAVAELGWIAGSGVLLCAFACFTVLPALLMLFDRRGEMTAATIPIHTETGWLPRLTGRPRWVLGAGLAITALLGVCALCRVHYDHNLLHLQAQDLDSVQWEMKLIDHTAGASWYALSYTDSPEEARALKARYDRLPGVSRVVEVASLVPPDQRRKLEQLRDIRSRLGNLPKRAAVIAHLRDRILPDALSGRTARAELERLIVYLGPLSGGTAPPILGELRDQLVGLRDRMARLPDGVAGERLRVFEDRLAGSLAEDLHQLRDVTTPEPITVADLPPQLRERYVGRTGKWLLRVFARDCLWDFAPLEKFTQDIHAVDPEATGKPFSTVEGLKAMKSGFEWAGLYAFLVIVAVLVVDFRSLRNTLFAVAPLAIGLVLSLGIMGLCGVPLNPANMIAFPLILGVGVDNGVHVLHDFLLRRAAGRRTISYPIGRGVLVKALTTMIGFGTLMISSERGLAGLGLILTLGVGCCMVAALVFLPAALRLLGGRPAAVSEQVSDRLAA
jgi:hopanoid biosynthesis associated RND transporter like protein HpnN